MWRTGSKEYHLSVYEAWMDLIVVVLIGKRDTQHAGDLACQCTVFTSKG